MSEKQMNVPKLRYPGFTGEWEKYKLSEIATMHARIGWQNLRTSEFLDKGDYMLITGTDFDDGSINFETCHYVEKERYEQDKHIQISNGSILITKDGTLGKVAYVQGLAKPATLNAGVFNVEIINEAQTDGKYLFQFLKAPFLMDYVGQRATGGTIKHLNQNILVDFPVVMPQKAEQEKIGEFLINIDTLISLQQRKLDQIKEYKKGMLQKMFPNEGDSVPELRFPGFTGKWERRKFGEITELKSASRVHRNEWTKTGVPFYRSSDVMSALNGTDNTKAYISEELYEKLSAVSGRLEQGDILVTGGGSVGNPYKVPDNEPLYTKDADLLWVKRNERLHPDFVYQYFLSPVFRDYLSSISHVGTIAHYTITQLENTPVTLPTLEEQIQIGQFLTNLDTLITLHQRKLDAMREYKKGLLQQMFV